MRIALAQINPTLGDIEANKKLILNQIDKAYRKGSDLVVFPELALCGFSPKDLLWQEDLVSRLDDALQEIVASTNKLGVVLGSITKTDNNRNTPTSLYNTAFFINDGRIAGQTIKENLSRNITDAEARYFSPGPGSQVITFRGAPIGLTIGADLSYDLGPIDSLCSLGAELIINVSASPFYCGCLADKHKLAKHVSTQNHCRIVYVNGVGGQDNLVYDGGSFVTGQSGTVTFQAPEFRDTLSVIDVDYPETAAVSYVDSMDQLRSAITLGIHDYVAKNNFEQVIVGSSGGIDSALVAALATEALGADAVTTTFLPSTITSQQSREDAQLIAHNLGTEFLEIPISAIADTCIDSLPMPLSGTTKENLQARIRGTMLMTIANERHALVLATGNKSEISVGYTTLYGDTVGAIAPIADLYKTEVYDLAKRFGDCIPPNVLTKAPTAELRPGQRDTDDLPPYKMLDQLLFSIIEEDKSARELLKLGFPKEELADILARYYQNEFKRHQLPPAIAVKRKSVQLGKQFPITHNFRG